MKNINIIAAVDKKYGIAKNGIIPWYIKRDLLFFNAITTGQNYLQNHLQKQNVVILGKNSWKTMPDKCRGLSNRINIVVSTTMTKGELDNDNKTGAKCVLVTSLDDAFEFCERNCESINEIFVCGGVNIYKKSIKKCIISTIYITYINEDYNCTSIFPVKTMNEYFSRSHVDQNVIDKFDNVTIVKYDIVHNKDEYQYLNLLKSIVKNGDGRDTRNAPTYSIFGPQIQFDLQNGFPLLTTKKMFWKGITEELLFFLRGETDTTILKQKGVHIWDKNTCREFLDSRNLHHYKEGEMGPMYGYLWRHFGNSYDGTPNKDFDQLDQIIKLIKNDPNSRRILMTNYDPTMVEKSVLAPCHGLTIQFYVDNNNLSCKMYQRSVDCFLGLPFNIASYALLTHIIAKVTGLNIGKLILTFGDTHIYKDHINQCLEQLDRIPYGFPNLKITKEYNKNDDPLEYICNLQHNDFILENYKCHSLIKANMIA